MPPLPLAACAAAAAAALPQLAWSPVGNATWMERGHFGAAFTAGGAMLVTGGISVRNNNSHLNDVWRSADGGATWQQLTAAAPWPSRHRHGAALFRGCVYVFGGTAGAAYYNDVWRSCDEGASWECVAAHAPWAPREGFGFAVAGGRLLVIGGTLGGTGGALDEVWGTEDGGEWELLSGNTTAPATPWEARYGLTAVTAADGSVLIAGGLKRCQKEISVCALEALNDVWGSADGGRTWALRTAKAAWSGRLYVGLATAGGNTYLFGGQASGLGIYRTLSDVWGTADGSAWEQLAGYPAGMAPRSSMAVLVPPPGNAAVLLGGTSEIFPHRDYNDVWRAELPAARAYGELCALLRRNKDAYDPSWSPPGLPPALFQDHIAFDLVSLYNLGANASRLDAAYSYHQQTELLAPALPAAGQINASNWAARVGESPVLMPLYSDYVAYYRARLAAAAPQAVLDAHLPALVGGVFGKLFHGLLAMGWVYAESGGADAEALAQGLAWMSVASSPPAPLGAGAVAAAPGALAATFAAARADAALPTFRGDPQSLYYVFLADLQANHSEAMQAHDLAFPASTSAADAVTFADDMAGAALDLFAAGNFTSYTHVHVIEAVRALRNVLPMVSDGAARAELVRRVWQAVVYNFVIQNRPPSAPAGGAGAAPRAWAEITAGAMAQGDTHLHNIVWVGYAERGGRRAAQYHAAADAALRIFEAGGTWGF